MYFNNYYKIILIKLQLYHYQVLVNKKLLKNNKLNKNYKKYFN